MLPTGMKYIILQIAKNNILYKIVFLWQLKILDCHSGLELLDGWFK